MKTVENKNTQAICNIQLEIALRLDKQNWLQKIIASDRQPDYVKSAAQDDLAKLAADHEADIRKLETLKAEQPMSTSPS